MTRRLAGWAFVAAQAALLAALIFLPGRDDWPTPSWATTLGYGLVLAGLGLIAVASLRLGSALTPTPVPSAHGTLATQGLYRLVRHPIYTGVLVIVGGLTLRSGSILTAAVAAATVGFFHVKARWEERQLAVHYADYAAYAERTPRFVPSVRRSS